MGVVGDPSRTSTVIADKPFMGLVPESTTSWAEEEYSHCHVNTCWELYGVTDEQHFPSSGIYCSAHVPCYIIYDIPKLDMFFCSAISLLTL